jgi:outer membrane receptor for Fe3+-dicitrate
MVSQEHVGQWMDSFWAQNTINWLPWLKTNAALRFDRVNMNMTADENPLNSGSAAANKWSPKFSAIFGPWAKTEFFYNIGQGLHSNDARGVINKVDPTTGEAASTIPALVSSLGDEVGMRSQFFPYWQTSLAFWRLRSASELVYSADSGIGNTAANGASVRAGIEWNNHWDWNNRWLLDADGAWTHAQYVVMNDNGQLGNQIPNAVGKVGILRLTLRDVASWNLGWETRYIGSYPLTQDGSQNAPASAITHFRASRALERDVKLHVDLLNVFNRQYYDIAYNQDYQLSPNLPSNLNGITVHPGEPRQLRVGVSVYF